MLDSHAQRPSISTTEAAMKTTSNLLISGVLIAFVQSLIKANAPGQANAAPQFFESCNYAPNRSGIYTIAPSSGIAPFQVYCEQERYDGHWLLFQNRQDGSTSFNRSWNDYKLGFGSLQREFWLGLEKLHHITNDRRCGLLVVMANFTEYPVYRHYTTFGVANEANNYKLKLLGFMEGTAGESFYVHRSENFSTYDRDNDRSEQNCATLMGSGHWHYKCGTGSSNNNLNGIYSDQILDDGRGVWWGAFGGTKNPLKWTKMYVKIRPGK
ncbi:microfibril-associated glycoprotein 4-like [Sabethes cyaneus]|uniref:microfibril-associated glycoprotein 4-like n=1 Tax=Sabethes cyaneus TaxID=53552 RepID=UPI00237EB41B|nr:microfibril-associated glycoprotein 4-like [Sabethes cyaneus]